MYKKKLILGLGPGRSGTMSLAKFLDTQARSYFVHEGAYNMPEFLKYTTGRYLPWEVNLEEYSVWYSELLTKSSNALYFGDVSASLLSYVQIILEKHPESKFICIKRDREAVVRSFLRVTTGVNHWKASNHRLNKLNLWYHLFPKIDGITKEESIRAYVDAYYDQAGKIENKYPNSFKIFNIDDLNSTEGRNAIVSFAQISPRDAVVDGHFHTNKSTYPIFHFIFQVLSMMYVAIGRIKRS
jgi:hypothetical protein